MLTIVPNRHRVWRGMMVAVVVGLVAAGCDTTNGNGNGNNNGNGNSNNNSNNNQSNGNSNDMPFEPLNATEKLIEGEREDDQAGTSRTRDEQYHCELYADALQRGHSGGHHQLQ